MKQKMFKIIMFSSALGLSSCIDEPQVSEWHHVAVNSRSAITIPYSAFASETEVSLGFSDGTSWKGAPSYVRPGERFLLHSQIGDSVWWRYNSLCFAGRQWSE